ncbi:hypothetical protein SAMN04490198_1901 [Pseudomonas palleroniana]|uniref:Uncharacterized protein n=1 Tax=Pseudomonas palleroniana TaxID=191390 RepID=A0A1H5JVK1_9PSED|nr:hypothetical protein SAMN04490198_1901 [Pseudomonas palleroniana]
MAGMMMRVMKAEYQVSDRSHALRGNAALDALRPLLES